MEIYSSQPRLEFVRGKLTLIIEFYGNNFKCPHFEKGKFIEFKEESLIELKEVEEAALSLMDEAEQILIGGGEPTLQRSSLIRILQSIQKYNVRKIPIEIESNLSKWKVIEELLIKDLIDRINIQYYSPLEKDIFERVTRASTFFVGSEKIIEDVKKSLEILKVFKNKKRYYVTTLIAPGLIYRVEDLLKIAPDVKELDAKWIIKSFEPGKAYSKRFRQIKPASEILLSQIAKEIKKAYPEIEIELD